MTAGHMLPVALIATTIAIVHPSSARGDDEAEALVRRGVELRESGDEQGARALFRRSYARNPTPKAAAQLGLTEFSLGEYAQAYAHLSEALKAKTNPWIRRYRSHLEQALHDVRKRVGFVRIVGETDAATVTVNGEQRGRIPLEDLVMVNAGAVEVVVSHPGFRAFREVVEVRADVVATVVARLQREEPRKPPPQPSPTAPLAAPNELPRSMVLASRSESDVTPPPIYKRGWFWVGVATVVIAVGAVGVWSARTIVFPEANGGGGEY